MNTGRLRKVLRASFLALLLIGFIAAKPAIAKGDSGTGSVNRFNVVMVLDASGSMTLTDPEGLRFKAIDQFAFLLAESGNRLGGVVFTSKIRDEDQIDLAPVNSQADKDKVTARLAAVPANGDTNIGAALDAAVQMIEKKADPNLPSVILLLTDGITDLPGASKEELQRSLDQKAASVQRARDKSIPIYSVCLNVDGTAKTTEMQQISEATNGKFIDVKTPEDLIKTFYAYYGLIYGSTALPMSGTYLPGDKYEVNIPVPNFGVEEVNITIFGNADSYEVKDSKGKTVPVNVVDDGFPTMLKITNVIPDNWKLTLEGVPKDAVEVDMVYNTNLEIEATIEPETGSINPEDSIVAKAFLSADGTRAKNAKQYVGYEAELMVFDTFDAEVETVPMALAKDHFEIDHNLPEGSYKFKVHVSGNSLDRMTDFIGEMLVSSKTPPKDNHAPKPIEDPKEDPVFILPFRDNSYTLDVTTLATDEDGDELQYKVVSSSYMEDDYTVDGNTLSLTNFRWGTGDFTVRAVDPYGKYCDIKVVVKVYNVGVLALIFMVVLALIGAIAFIVVLRIALSKPFRGTITVESVVDGNRSMPKSIKGGRGRMPLMRFNNLDPTGLDYAKSYLQATGGRTIVLNTNLPVSCNGQQGKKTEINAGSPVTVVVSSGKQLVIHFDSVLSQGPGFGNHGGGKNSGGKSRGGFGGRAGFGGGFGSNSSTSSSGFGGGVGFGAGGFGGGQSNGKRYPPVRPSK